MQTSTNATFFFVADRGALKIFLDSPASSDTRLRHTQTLEIEPGRQSIGERTRDQAGRFPNTASEGQGNSIGERQTLVAETEMKAFRQIAAKIIEVLEANKPAAWSFAAPEEINGAILDGIPRDLRATLEKNVKKDLVNVPIPELVRHFAE